MTTEDGGALRHTFAKILRLERQGGFRNRAVAGGMDAFLQRWRADLQPILDASVSYADMDDAQRRRWVGEALSRTGDAAPETASAPRAAQSPKPIAAANVTQTAAPAKRAPNSPARKSTSTKPARKRAAPRPPANAAPLRLDDDVSRLNSVSARVKPRLNRLGIQTVQDLIYHFPHRHDDFTKIRSISELAPGEMQTTIATLWEINETSGRGRSKSAQAVVGDDTGNIRVIWFNQGYLAKTLRPGARLVISGTPKLYLGRLAFQSPEYEIFEGWDNAARLAPVYPLTDGLYQRTLRRCVKEALDRALARMRDYLPSDMLRAHDLLPLKEAVSRMHYPDSADDAEAARRRLAFDELLMLQLSVARRRVEWQSSGGAVPLQSDRKSVV